MEKEKIKQRLADINTISIALDNYDDIFSDFDPRAISERDLSEDLIVELQRRHRENPRGKYEVVFHAPVSVVDKGVEKKVIQRIKRNFSLKFLQQIKLVNRLRLRGSIFLLSGTTSLAILTLITYSQRLDPLLVDLLGIVLMPLGWFGIWEGFSKIIDAPLPLQREAEVFKKFSKASYKFEYLGEEI
jgi:hypothetical protein